MIRILLILVPLAASQDLALNPDDLKSSVHPRKFGLPGGVGVTRGWYVWHSYDPKTEQAVVSHEQTKEKYTVRVLPWLSTYRHLAYGAHPDELLPGERVNCFFNPSDKQQRAYLVHFQDEMCQMKGHNHAWQIEKLVDNGFVARGMGGDKPLDDKSATFTFDPKCKFWHEGKATDGAQAIKKGERLYLTWCYEDQRRVVKLCSDAASLNALQSEAKKRIAERVKREGMTGFIEEAGPQTRVLLFATWWQQAGDLKAGDKLRLQYDGVALEAKLVARKNLGTYGSGCTEMIVDGLDAKQIEIVRSWVGSKVVRVFAP